MPHVDAAVPFEGLMWTIAVVFVTFVMAFIFDSAKLL